MAGGKDTVKALRTDKQASSWKGEKALYKSNLSVMGRVKFEVGKLYDSPGITLQETVPLKNTKSVGGKLLSAFSSVKEEDMPKLTYACKFIPLDDDPELEEARAARLAGITAKDLKNPDGEKFDVEDFCGVLHCKLLRATNLVSRDANGFSDPFVRCSFGRQIHKSSVKYETLHPCGTRRSISSSASTTCTILERSSARFGTGTRTAFASTWARCASTSTRCSCA